MELRGIAPRGTPRPLPRAPVAEAARAEPAVLAEVGPAMSSPDGLDGANG